MNNTALSEEYKDIVFFGGETEEITALYGRLSRDDELQSAIKTRGKQRAGTSARCCRGNCMMRSMLF